MPNKRPYNILVALLDVTYVQMWADLAAALAPENHQIHLRGMVIVPEGVSLSEGVTRARLQRDALYQIANNREDIHDLVNVVVDYQPLSHILDELHQNEYDLLLIQWQGPLALTGGVATTEILRTAPCDVVLLCREGWEQTGDVLLSLRGGPNLSLGVRVAKAMAQNGGVTLFNTTPANQTPPDLQSLLHPNGEISRIVTALGDATNGILHEIPAHKAVVMGASFIQPGAGSVMHQVYEASRSPIALVRKKHPEALEFHPLQPISQLEIDLSTRVDRWFAENTYHSHEFSDLRDLVALKEKQGLTISVGLPALNEEKTVGHVINILKTALMDEVPLVDEIVLIDSNSTDNTMQIAESYGIPVYKHPDILSEEVGSYRGKGEALWKSLHVLKGDIIAWVDTDITNIHPRFIYGLLGPLLKRPNVQFVKGFYQRPIKVDDKLQAYGGGRVTELVARPLLNLFYPELSGLVQPLSGEYAGRRTALEQLPFFSGYGVETGMLIDLLDHFGLDALVQTDLEVRVHHNQPLVGLSKMSFAILQVFIARIEKRYGVQLLDNANRSMKLIIQDPERLALEINEIGDVERPPMISIPAYRKR